MSETFPGNSNGSGNGNGHPGGCGMGTGETRRDGYGWGDSETMTESRREEALWVLRWQRVGDQMEVIVQASQNLGLGAKQWSPLLLSVLVPLCDWPLTGDTGERCDGKLVWCRTQRSRSFSKSRKRGRIEGEMVTVGIKAAVICPYWVLIANVAHKDWPPTGDEGELPAAHRPPISPHYL